jgi:hypothetical protein
MAGGEDRPALTNAGAEIVLASQDAALQPVAKQTRHRGRHRPRRLPCGHEMHGRIGDAVEQAGRVRSANQP